jgi:hypothetical protein
MARGCITGWHEVGKGTKRRPEDSKALDANWERIFGKKEPADTSTPAPQD